MSLSSSASSSPNVILPGETVAEGPVQQEFEIITSGLQAPPDGAPITKKKLTVDQLKKIEEDHNKPVHVPRKYQLDLFEKAKMRNTIAVMDTGTGKTLIAVLVIKHVLAMENERRKSGGTKRLVFFLVPTVPLVFQQKDYMQHQIIGQVMPLCGELIGESFQRADWQKIVNEKDVICATPQILVHALNHAFISMDQISMLIFDEAHNATGDHPYAVLMKEHYRTTPPAQRPKIFGLTASPVNSAAQPERALAELEYLLHSTAITILINSEVRQYAARAKPHVVEYVRRSPSLPQPPLFQKLSAIQNRLLGLKKIVKDAKIMLNELGPWCCERNLWMSLESMQKSKERVMSLDMDAALKGSRMIADPVRQLLDECRHMYPAPVPAIDAISPKVATLIQLLESYQDDAAFCGIVFVQRRDTAERLGELLRGLPPLQRFLRVGVLMGHAIDDVYRMTMKMTEQFQTVREFRKGKLNLLVATKVAEEGLDIPACKLVVRFNLGRDSMNLVNYIQSRGRARARDAKFVLMREKDNEEHTIIVEDMRWREYEVRESLRTRSIKVEEVEREEMGWDAVSLAPPYKYIVDKTGATVTLTSALPILHHFVSTQERDQYTPPPRAEYSLMITPEGLWKASVMLPATVPVEGRFSVGKPMQSKALANRMAAYEAVKKLHQLGLLDDNLSPIVDTTRVKTKRSDEFLERQKEQEELNQLKGKKKKRHYPTKVPDLLLQPWAPVGNSPYIVAHLNVIDTTQFERAPVAQDFGFLTISPLPVSPLIFPIWPLMAEVNVRIVTSPTPVHLTVGQYAVLKRYHSLLMGALLKHFEGDAQQAYVVVPIRVGDSSRPMEFRATDPSYMINWELAQSAATFDPKAHRYRLRSEKALEFVVQDNGHWGRKYIPLEIVDKTPFDEVPFEDAKFKCAADYYTTKKNDRIRREKPLIKAKLVSRKVNMLAYYNIAQNEAVESKTAGEVFLIPQFCEVYPIPTSTMTGAAILPSVLYFVELIYKAHELRLKLDLPVELPQLLTAITAPSATMQFNYERYETLGDSFLKMALTLHLFANHPHRSEGLLSMYMSNLQSNHSLFKAATLKKMQGYVIATKLSRTTWKPIVVRDPNAEELQITEVTDGKDKASVTQLLSDKQVADTVEAILGACYDSRNIRGAAQALHNIYHEMFAVDWNDYYRLVRIDDGPVPPERQITVDKVQELFGYRFKHPRLLLEAFTHPTSANRSGVPCYQRLEFLGDAVLGFLAVRLFFYRHKELPPGRLVDLKDAAVNNAFLACVSANLGLHQHLEHFSSPLADAISDFCNELYRVAEQRKTGNTTTLLPDPSRAPKTKAEQKAMEEERKKEVQYWMDIEAPKAVSDIFEAMCGAIWLDSELDVEVVWDALQRTWLPWVNAYIQPHLVGRHPYREMAMMLRRQGCDEWRVPTKHDSTEGLFVANLIVHGEVVCLEYGTSRKSARKALAEMALEMVKEDPNLIKGRCNCVGVEAEEEEVGTPGAQELDIFRRVGGVGGGGEVAAVPIPAG